MILKLRASVFYVVLSLTVVTLSFLGGSNYGYYTYEQRQVEANRASDTTNPSNTRKVLNTYETYDLINDYRASKGLAKLKFNPAICPFTDIRLKQIHSDWSHNGWLSAGKYFRYVYFGENLIKGYDTPKTAVDAWVSSPEHLKNIVDPHYTDTCIESDYGTDNTNGELNVFVVQHFASF